MFTYRRVLAFTALLLSAACAHVPAQTVTPDVLGNATQLIVVTTSGWDSIPGELRRFTRTAANAPWRSEGAAIPIVVGKTGLAWGVGFDAHALAAEPHKREGDGKSPAGIFPVTTAFGFAPRESVAAVRLSYVQLTPSIECVDDTASVHYNTVLDRNNVARVDWNSSEKMSRVAQYRLGAVIDYNTPATKGRGSCIFFHIWGGPHAPTVGCTAMEPANVEQLVSWLDPRAKPVLVQVPASVYSRIRGEWSLPAL